jgi:hypothetical protein
MSTIDFGFPSRDWAFWWGNRIQQIKDVVRSCNQCQLVKSKGFIRSEPIEFKSIPIWDQFNKVAFNTTSPLLETKFGNKYVLVAINHYSKWCETKVVVDHDA